MNPSPSCAHNPKRAYVFDGHENLIGMYETVTACAEALKVKRQAVTMAISRASIMAKKYYVSYQDKFTRQNKQKEFNPLRQPARAPHTAAGTTLAGVPKKAMFPKIPVAAAPTKTAAKRTTGMAQRFRSAFPYQEERAFWPVSSFH